METKAFWILFVAASIIGVILLKMSYKIIKKIRLGGHIYNHHQLKLILTGIHKIIMNPNYLIGEWVILCSPGEGRKLLKEKGLIEDEIIQEGLWKLTVTNKMKKIVINSTREQAIHEFGKELEKEIGNFELTKRISPFLLEILKQINS